MHRVKGDLKTILVNLMISFQPKITHQKRAVQKKNTTCDWILF